MAQNMRDKIELTGIVLSSTLVGDYDKRLVILTKERGKITTFARSARKPNSPYLGISEPFNFGTFTLMEGYDAYRLVGAEIKEYFLDVKNDIEGICYGTYFCEVLEYLCVDGIGDINVLNLIYMALKSLGKKDVPNALVRRIFELRILAHDGEGMAAFRCPCCGDEKVVAYVANKNGLVCDKCAQAMEAHRLSESTVYTIQYVLGQPINKLFTFCLTEETWKEFDMVVSNYFTKHIDKKFKSLEILASLS